MRLSELQVAADRLWLLLLGPPARYGGAVSQEKWKHQSQVPGSSRQLPSDLCFSPPQELYYEDRHYHESCFRCFRCDRSLADEPFTCQGQELLCNGCYCREFSSQCVACQQVVMPGALMMPRAPDPAAPGLLGAHPPSLPLPTGSRKLEYSGQTWHEHCFICSSCQQPIGARSFIPEQNEYYCVPCYESKFAPRCTRCKKVGS